ncbi:cell division protein ZapA [bacterium]|nr:cell division protein ZapA [bacterium]
MGEERHGIKVNIFGSEYVIRGEADEAYIQSLAQYVNEKMKEIAQSTHLTSPVKIAMLASINMADDIFRLRERLQDKSAAQQTSLPQEPLPEPAPELLETEISSVAPEAITALSQHIKSALEEE